MKICNTCDIEYDDNNSYCSICASQLVVNNGQASKSRAELKIDKGGVINFV